MMANEPPASTPETLIRAGRIDEAIAAYQARLATDADRADDWFNLAWLLRTTRRFEDALSAYEEALARGVARPAEAHVNRAAILADHLFRPDEAEADLRASLKLDPLLLQAWLNLGNLHEDLGRVDAAREAYTQAMRIAPGHGRAHARLAALDTTSGGARGAVARLRSVLDQADSPADRAEMLFALGAASDAVGDAEDAFQAVEAANWIAAATSPARYNHATQARFVDRVIATYQERPAAEVPAKGPRPVFICGMFRSGSTLVEQLLAQHPAICAGGELEFVPALVAGALPGYPEAPLPIEEIGALRDQYFAELPQACRDARVITDKRCDNVFHLGLIKTIFADALIVHTRRAPLDNILSIHMLHFGEGVTYSRDLRDAAHHYIEYRRVMTHWRRLFGDDICDVDYDAVVRDPRSALAPVLDALDLTVSDLPSGKPVEGTIRTASAWQVRQPLHTRSSGRWQRYARQLADVRQILLEAGIDPEQ